MIYVLANDIRTAGTPPQKVPGSFRRVEALYDAADDDSATGGPDLVRGIYPTAVVLAAEGAEDIAEERIAALAREVIESRSRKDTFGPDSAAQSHDARGDS